MEHSETVLDGGGRNHVTRRGDIVYREARPWSGTVIALLKHLEARGFAYAPRVAGNGFDATGREAVHYIEGGFVHPGPWPDEALPEIGRMLRALHEASADFHMDDAVWRGWYGRTLGTPSVIGHCDTGSWNIVARDRHPIALIDWEEAGPVDPLVELAQACWLNAQLFDDDIAAREGLGSVAERGRQARLLLDGYGLKRSERAGMVERMRDFAILSAANEAIEADVTPESRDPAALWGITWRARSAAWIVRNRQALEAALI